MSFHLGTYKSIGQAHSKKEYGRNNWWIDHMNYRNGSYIMCYITLITKYVPELREWLLHNVLYHIDHQAVSWLPERFLHNMLLCCEHLERYRWNICEFERVSDYYLRPARLCHHETKLIFNEMIMWSAFF